MREEMLTIATGDASVSALLLAPTDARAGYVLAHGAGAGMTHPFMGAVAQGLAARGIATLRYQFPYMERGSRRPDTPRVAHAAVHAAVVEAAQRLPGLPLFAGGKSFGGRLPAAGRARSGVPRVPAASGRQAVGRARGAFVRYRDSDAVPARQPRRPRFARTARARGRKAGCEGNAGRIRGRRPFLPRPRAQRPQGCAGAGRVARGPRPGTDRRPSGARRRSRARAPSRPRSTG